MRKFVGRLVIYAGFLVLLSYFCEVSSKVHRVNGSKTEGHVIYNQHVLFMLIKFLLLNCLLWITQRNCGIRNTYRQEELKKLLIAIRFIVVVYWIFSTVFDLSKLYEYTDRLHKQNNGHLTIFFNSEPFNAFLSGFLFYAMTLGVLMLFMLAFQYQARHHFGLLLLGVIVTCLLIEGAWYERTQRVHDYLNYISLVPSQNKKAIKFLNESKKKFSQLGIPKQECIICFVEYQPDDFVVKLNCSAKHIFHLDCLKSEIKYRTSCPLCRRDIFLPPPIIPLEIEEEKCDLQDDNSDNEPVWQKKNRLETPNTIRMSDLDQQIDVISDDSAESNNRRSFAQGPTQTTNNFMQYQQS